ncbi:MAG: hypothetical protein IKT26_02185, partial [Bacteroidaceae bacterium]|nr:hypothetical protein [Bacteroidaceae bacterium]
KSLGQACISFVGNIFKYINLIIKAMGKNKSSFEFIWRTIVTIVIVGIVIVGFVTDVQALSWGTIVGGVFFLKYIWEGYAE